jgi:hypothetical protein
MFGYLRHSLADDHNQATTRFPKYSRHGTKWGSAIVRKTYKLLQPAAKGFVVQL